MCVSMYVYVCVESLLTRHIYVYVFCVVCWYLYYTCVCSYICLCCMLCVLVCIFLAAAVSFGRPRHDCILLACLLACLFACLLACLFAC